MAVLVTAIRVFFLLSPSGLTGGPMHGSSAFAGDDNQKKDVDGRDKHGHDE
jgi:hypothetical protein